LADYESQVTSRHALALALGAIAALSLFASLLTGSVRLAPLEVARSLMGESSPVNVQIIRELRLPRALAAFGCGGALAGAGAILQALMRNALADPYILGVSGGASVGALGALAFGLPVIAVNGLAFAGAIAALALLFWLGARGFSVGGERVLLIGVVLAAGLSAVVTLFLVLAPQAQLRGMLFWLTGDLSRASAPWWVLTALAVTAVAGARWGTGLDLATLGEEKARSLGLNVGAFQVAMLGCAGLATTAAVVTAGTIGFVGLLTPHALRLLGVAENRLLVPLAALAGGAFLVFADLAARTVAAPIQLPVGALTALIGVPLMLLLLMRGR
jgi:iron complex transport system permease protein